MPEKTVVAYLYKYADEFPEKPAVISGERKASYRELSDLSLGYASFLKAKGFGKGDIAVIRASQTLDYVVAYLAVHTAGGVVTSAEKNVPTDSIISIAQTVGAKIVISTEADKLPLNGVLQFSSCDILNDAQSTPHAEFSLPDEDDSADILFTTGTTGASKGVELSHKALVATAENLIYGCGYRKDTTIIVPGPLNHANPIRKLLATIVNGSTIHLLNGMTDIKAFYTALDNKEGTLACCLPPAAIRTLFTLTGDTLGNYADRIDFIESATAPLPEPDKLRLSRLLPKTRLYNNYGSSEAASVCMYDYNANPGKSGCIGKMMPNSEVIIVDDDRNVIVSSKDRMGYLACRGDVVMKGYINEPDLTRSVLSDGVVYTNDVGYIDGEGFVYIVGRADDVINVGGLKVAPAEVEEAALAIGIIDDCICIPVANPITGQALKLLVVMKDGEEFSPKAFTSFLQTKLEGYKVPTKYEVVESVERTYNGKLNRKAYR